MSVFLCRRGDVFGGVKNSDGVGGFQYAAEGPSGQAQLVDGALRKSNAFLMI